MVQISNLLKQSSDSNLIQGFVTSPVRCILTFSQIRHFKRIDLKILFNSYAFHEYYCWAFENLINTLGGPMTDYLSVLVFNPRGIFITISASSCILITTLVYALLHLQVSTFEQAEKCNLDKALYHENANLTQRKKMTKCSPKNPFSSEGRVWGDRNCCEAHDDVRHSHVHQVHLSVRPKNLRSVN